jgi:cell division protease FtsH
MVCSWGMSEKMGMVDYGDNDQAVFVARDMGRGGPNYSGATAQKIDEEVKRLIDEAYTSAKNILLHHKAKLDAIAIALLEYETLDGSHIKDIMQHGHMQNPPNTKPPAPTPPPVPKVQEARPARNEDESSIDGLPGGLIGVPT